MNVIVSILDMTLCSGDNRRFNPCCEKKTNKANPPPPLKFVPWEWSFTVAYGYIIPIDRRKLPNVCFQEFAKKVDQFGMLVWTSYCISAHLEVHVGQAFISILVIEIILIYCHFRHKVDNVSIYMLKGIFHYPWCQTTLLQRIGFHFEIYYCTKIINHIYIMFQFL